MNPEITLTKWQNFLHHSLDIHKWKKVKKYDAQCPLIPCGPFDPSPKTELKPMVDIICCVCGKERTLDYKTWIFDYTMQPDYHESTCVKE